MNLQPSNRRQDIPVRLGNHGYRLDGDFAWLNAELHVPPYFSGSDFGLELWACKAPHSGASPEGVKVAEIPLELPTPIGPHVHQVEARVAVTPPLGDAPHSMVLLLVANTGLARRIHDFSNYGRLQRFEQPRLIGAVGYSIDGDQVVLEAARVENSRPEGNSSGTLALELWALSEPYAGGTPLGQRLAGAELGSISGQYHLPNVERRSTFTQPSPGSWHVALLLREWTVANGYTTRDYRNFDLTFEQAAPAAAQAAPAVAQAAPAVAQPAPAVAQPAPAVAQPAPAVAQPAPTTVSAAEKLRLIKPEKDAGVAPVAAAVVTAAPVAAAPVAAAPVVTTPVVTTPVVAAPVAAAPVAAAPVAAAPVAAAPVAAAPVGAAPVAAAPVAAAPVAAAPVVAAPVGRVLLNVHTATVEELSRLPGLSVKVAKEIVKGRPFASLDALVEVRGVGEKTLRRIKSLLSL